MDIHPLYWIGYLKKMFVYGWVSIVLNGVLGRRYYRAGAGCPPSSLAFPSLDSILENMSIQIAKGGSEWLPPSSLVFPSLDYFWEYDWKCANQNPSLASQTFICTRLDRQARNLWGASLCACGNHLGEKVIFKLTTINYNCQGNIARVTTDPGYWLCISSYIYSRN